MAPAKKQKKEADGPADTYTPKNIMVTGGAGFIASHVVIRIVKAYPQYKVVCLDKMDYCSSLRNLDEVKDEPNFKFIKGNILSADLIKYVLKTEEIDTIIHAAAQTHVDNSFGNSFAFTENNVLGTHVLLESAKLVGIKRFIHVSTDEVYGSSYQDEPRRREGDTLEPTNPYAATKAAAEAIARSYWYSFKMPVIVTRGNNVFGPHQYPEKIVPKFVRRLVAKQPCCIHGDGSNSRHFIYVGDVAAAFDTLLHSGVDGEVYNIGCEDEYTNLEVAEKIVKMVMPECKDPKEQKKKKVAKKAAKVAAKSAGASSKKRKRVTKAKDPVPFAKFAKVRDANSQMKAKIKELEKALEASNRLQSVMSV